MFKKLINFIYNKFNLIKYIHLKPGDIVYADAKHFFGGYPKGYRKKMKVDSKFGNGCYLFSMMGKCADGTKDLRQTVVSRNDFKKINLSRKI